MSEPSSPTPSSPETKPHTITSKVNIIGGYNIAEANPEFRVSRMVKDYNDLAGRPQTYASDTEA